MKIVCASDSFKGSLSSTEICQIIKQASCDIFGDIDFTGIAMADGGEGTLDAIGKGYADSSFDIVSTTVLDPLGRSITAEYIVLSLENKKTAVIELSKASGLTLLSTEERNPLITSTYGTGQLILHALEQGCEHILIGIGGSATNDGGTGALEALGVRFYDKNRNILHGNGKNLGVVDIISIDELSPLLQNASFTVMCDVKNPLTGKNGATYIYGPQKGASGEMLVTLEENMMHYESLLNKLFSCDTSTIIGGGAAGGIGAALSLFLHAEMIPGAEAILSLHNFSSLIADADLVITGEGSIDSQTSNGKVAAIVGQFCKNAYVPCCAIVGSCAEDVFPNTIPGITEILAIKPADMSVADSIKNAHTLYDQAVRKLFSDMKSIHDFLKL